jgi:hypothetical protein
MQEEMWRRMLRLKTIGEAGTTGARKRGSRAVTGALAAGLLMAGAAQGWAQGSVAGQQTQTTVPITTSKIALAAPVTYDNKYEIFGALNFMNFQAGQALPKRMNLGGGEILGTYWLPGDIPFLRNLGVGVDYRIDAGTTPVFANSGITAPSKIGNTGINNRPLVYLNTFMAGAQYRSRFRNQYAALNFHGYAGVSHGTFNYSLKDLVVSLPEAYAATGLYSNRTKPIAALGASIDFNLSKRMAIRLSPDLILEHFGTETREFVSVSGGVIYRIGKKK